MSFRLNWRAITGIMLIGALIFTASSVSAARADRMPPTKPGNLRVIAKTQTTASLAWNASTDNSGSLSYRVKEWREGNWAVIATLPRTQTSHTAVELRPNVQYYFVVEAVDPSSNKSTSDLAIVTTEPDRTAPPAPDNLRVMDVTASQISLAWDASADDTGIREYIVSVSPSHGALSWMGQTSVTIIGLAPSTEYTFSVKARDFGYNVSPAGNTVSATTSASTDTQPPTAPANLRVDNWDCEVELTWTQSTDNQDTQASIRYEIFINGAPDPTGFSPIGVGRFITYGVVNGENTFVLRAVDSAGNVSGPSNAVTRSLTGC